MSAKKPKPIEHEEIVRHFEKMAREHEQWSDAIARHIAAIYREAIRRLEEWNRSDELTRQARRARRKP